MNKTFCKKSASLKPLNNKINNFFIIYYYNNKRHVYLFILLVDKIPALANLAGVHCANLHNEATYPGASRPDSIFTAIAPDQGLPIEGNRSSFDVSSKKV